MSVRRRLRLVAPRIAHPVSVPEHIVDALAGRGRRLGLGAQCRDEGPEPSGVQLGLPGLGPGVGEVRSGAVDGLGRVAQMLLGVVDVDDFDGAGKLLGGQVPDPGGAVAEDDPAERGVETAPLRLAMDASCEDGRLRVGVAARRALDRGVVADRPGVAAGPALGVAPFGRPHGDQLDLAGLGGAIGLLAAAPVDFGGAYRHAGAVQPEVHRGRGRRCGLLGAGALVTGDLASQRFGGTFDLPGLDIYPGQGRQQLARLGETDLGCRQSDQARGGR